MTTLDLRTFGYRIYDAINERDAEALEKLFDPHVVRHATGETGIEKAKQAMVGAFSIFPNMHFVVEDVLVDGNKFALRVTIHGIPTTIGEPQPTILEIFRIENGRVVEIWGAGTMRQPT